MPTVSPKPIILIIEDHPDTRRFLEVMLNKEFEIITAENGVIGIDYARNKNPDLIILDIMLPILSGYDTCSLIKKDEKTRHIPVIFLSAKNTVTDITLGLTTGADDYIAKPFDYKELKARISARLRRGPENNIQPIHLGELKIDPANRIVQYGNESYQLTLTEFDILRILASKAGTVVSRDEILDQVWRDDAKEANDRTIDVHVRALRKKMPVLMKHVMSVYGVGYKYEK